MPTKQGRSTSPASSGALDRRQLLIALRAYRHGNFGTRLPQEFSGLDGEICEAFNAIAEQAKNLESEVVELKQAIANEGRTGRRLHPGSTEGGWTTIVSCVNAVLDDFQDHKRDVMRVVSAVAAGDLSLRIDVDSPERPLRGNLLNSANTLNAMVDSLAQLGSEVTRVAREVGVEGRLGAQANVQGASGAWKELTDNVNTMASNLTKQVREIARVTTAVANGDLTKTVNVEVQGEILELKDTINTMVLSLSAFASEVSRVAREVGTDGILGGQAQVHGISGVWQELTNNVNSMAQNLTDQVRNVAEVVTAIAQGDLSHKITVTARGEILTLKNTINSTVDKLSSFSSEVTRVARLVGTEGTLGVQAEVEGVSGVWKELTDNVNLMGRNLTDQVRDIAGVTTAVANGDLSRKITVEVRGEILTLKNTVNAMVDSLSSFADEVTRMAREVGTEGVLGGQARVPNVSGIWKELTDNVNSMASNLTNQVRNIAQVAGAVAAGDLSRKITVDAHGEVQDLKNTLNAMVDQLNSFSSEVTRVAREVGVEGKLGGQANVDQTRGIWKELTDNVNLMANNLTSQVRDIAVVTTAVARGDLTRKIAVDARGEILELKNTINTMVDQLSAFADEVTRLATDVGVEGRLGGQADVRGVSGTWRHLTDAVNSMANNLTDQVRNISEVASAIARGDLEKKIVVDARGEILGLKNTINAMVDQLRSFAEQVTRVAREVGTEGKLGGQASVEGVRGIWKELTDNVNQMADNLTNQVRDIANVASAIAAGDLGRKITVEVKGEILELKNTINTMVDQLSSFAAEVSQVARSVGVEGTLGGQARVAGVSGIWKELTDNVNLMASNLTNQVRDIARVTTAVAKGDLSRKITVEVKGEILELKNTVNTMVDQLSSFAAEVTRVAREVGTEGALGGQAEVRDVSGTWRELTDNVNTMAKNLTEQVRGIATVVTAVANGDLKQKLTLDAQGEIATLVATINDMIVTLSTFADQVTSVARDVGIEGKLGGQADVPGAAGIWRDLTNNVNELAGNLTRQVRAIGDVATAVTKGDLSRSITVEARGEVALLKDNLNQMILALARTTQVNKEQDWLKTNLARFTRMLQGQRDLLTVARQVLNELAPVVNAQYGAFYVADRSNGAPRLRLMAAYAPPSGHDPEHSFLFGEGLVGQVAVEQKRIIVSKVPASYVQVTSGLGSATPSELVVVPVIFEAELKGVIELASFDGFAKTKLAFLEQLLESLGIVIATIEATMRTDELLRQSQGLTEELRTQQEELQQTNEELEEKARQLTLQKGEVERKNREVEVAKEQLEEKANQLATTSRYKSQFLANMSHELRTPLNSLLILSKQLAENRNRTLNAKEVSYAENIHQAGADLLALINEVLDLAKIESGTMRIDIAPVFLSALVADVQRTFLQVAQETQLSFEVELSNRLPETILTDDLRLKQVLRNLLSNAFKFTETGGVVLAISAVPDQSNGNGERPVERIAFSVSDTGIGIAQDKQRVIFEAFQQADGGESRRYGGTGLGLSISREISALLGGELSVRSAPGKGSTFTLTIPFKVQNSESGAHVRPRVRTETSSEPVSGVPAASPESRAANERALLVVEEERALSDLLSGSAVTHGFKHIVGCSPDDAMRLAMEVRPDAIIVDLDLRDRAGWVVLDRLKHDTRTRHVPVQVVSKTDQLRRSLRCGAVGQLQWPVDLAKADEAVCTLAKLVGRRDRRVLVVESATPQTNLASTVVGHGVTAEVVASSAMALGRLRAESFDCFLLNLDHTRASGLDLLETLANDGNSMVTPVVVYCSEVLSDAERNRLRHVASNLTLHEVGSTERLLEKTTLVLHQPASDLSDDMSRLLSGGNDPDPLLRGKTVLVVDDDMRNVFSLTALLERHHVNVVVAETGSEALQKLSSGDHVDGVLMDIMMPQMDGYEATRRIRSQARFKALPVIALTAKAMHGDREKCLAAGASDYITKPVDADQLASLLRVWLYVEQRE